MNEHSLQAPFVFQFYNQALKKAKRNYKEDERIVALRKTLADETKEILPSQMGNVSTLAKSKASWVNQIAKKGITTPANAAVLISIIQNRKCSHILEFGTSLGVNAINMALQPGIEKVITIEGNSDLAQIANSNAAANNCTNLSVISNDIEKAIHELKSNNQKFDLIYLDANHTYKATKRYFELCFSIIMLDSIMIFDDINWSSGMRQAWEEIRQDNRVGLSIENHQFGIIFPHLDISKQHYTLDF
jgi:predicted O-methyltransferase YrrM